MASRTPLISRAAYAAAFCGAIVANGCFSLGDGVEPPLDRIYFPVGVALGQGADRLYVANSDFDLQFNGGTVLVLDAERIRQFLPTWCTTDADCGKRTTCRRADDAGITFGECVDDSGSSCGVLQPQTPSQQFEAPGLCEALDLVERELVLDGVKTAPFSTDIRYATYVDKKGKKRARLFVPVRGDATLHWMDVETEPGKGPVIDCVGPSSASSCDEAHRTGNETTERSPAGLALPPEPSSLGVSLDGRSIVLGHQRQGKISLFVNRDEGPILEQVLTGVASSPMAAAPVPAAAYQDPSIDLSSILGQFLFTYNDITQPVPYVELLRAWDEPSGGTNAFLQRAGQAPLTTSSAGYDSRGIAIDAFERDRCEAACDCALDASDAEQGCQTCMYDCAEIPLGVYVAQRTPAALLVGKTVIDDATGVAGDLPAFTQSVPLRGGPSRITTSTIINHNGDREPRVFVLSFDSAFLTIYDPRVGQVEARIAVGRGPQGIVVDAEHGLVYLAHFTDSFLSVVDVDQRHPTYGKVLLNIGAPVPPVSAQ